MMGAVAAAGAKNFAPLTAAIAPTSDSEAGVNTGSNTFSPNCVCTPGGGSGSYTYAWSAAYFSGTAGTWSINSGQGTPSAAIRVTGVTNLGSPTSVGHVVCRVTDTVTGLFVDSNTATYSYQDVFV